MPAPRSPSFLAAFLAILHIALHAYSQDENTPFVTYCYGDNFTTSSPYESNLRQLMEDLIASTPSSPSFFSFINSTSSPEIFGLAQCRPDVSPEVCSTCLNKSASTATNTTPAGCGLYKSGSLRSANCLLRYWDEKFYNSFEEQPFVSLVNTQNASASFSSQVQLLMKSVMASAAASALRFAVGVANDSADAMNIYGMGWCSMDLASYDCTQCLGFVLGKIQNGTTGGNGTIVSCMMKFENYQFYGSSMLTLSSSPLPMGGKGNKNKKLPIVAGASGSVALLLLFIFFILLLQRRKMKLPASQSAVDEKELQSFEIQVFDLSSIKKATNEFSNENKLGEGGFGPVYKGVLINGQEIAVKRSSATSVQGFEEMKNEIHFIAKVRHKNLVRLLGFCQQEEEKLLVYEFLPNGSLDKFLFDSNKRMQLDWKTRLKIIIGVGRGLLYLHEDSDVRIVHRDLKASNILLDSDMNPKISDFGLAKLFGVDETEKNTSRIIGTLGYMAPEYKLHGVFSSKSDVFSYGVLLLEIITGEKTNVHGSDEADNLLSYVWREWKQGTTLQVIDKSLGDQYPAEDALRCVQIGLLCVQEEQARRPNMSLVISMLTASTMKLPSPPTPAFYSEKGISVIQNRLQVTV